MYIIVYATSDFALANKAKKAGANVVKVNESQNLTKDMEKEKMSNKGFVTELLKALDIPMNFLGYTYYKHIFERCIDDPNYHNRPVICDKNGKRAIYAECADVFGTTPSRVEKALRYALSVGYQKNKETYEKIFNIKIDKCPTVSKFIAIVGEYLLEEKN